MFKWLIRKFNDEYSQVLNEESKKEDGNFKIVVQKGEKTIFLIDIEEALAVMIGEKIMPKKKTEKKSGENGRGDSEKKS